MKKCRFCAEDIQDEAVVCRYCGKPAVRREIEELAARWGRIGQAQRDAEWAALGDAEKTQLETFLRTRPAGSQAPAHRKVILWVLLGLVALAVACQFASLL